MNKKLYNNKEMIINMNETLQILSFNPETDFSLMAYESAVDNTYLQYLNVLDKERKNCLRIIYR